MNNFYRLQSIKHEIQLNHAHFIECVHYWKRFINFHKNYVIIYNIPWHEIFTLEDRMRYILKRVESYYASVLRIPPLNYYNENILKKIIPEMQEELRKLKRYIKRYLEIMKMCTHITRIYLAVQTPLFINEPYRNPPFTMARIIERANEDSLVL